MARITSWLAQAPESGELLGNVRWIARLTSALRVVYDLAGYSRYQAPCCALLVLW